MVTMIAVIFRPVSFSWNSITSNVDTDSQGRDIYVGYEILMNDHVPTSYDLIATDKTGVARVLREYASTSLDVTLKTGEKASVKVRAVYYHEEEVKDENGNVTDYKYVIDQTGEWSDELIYKAEAIKAAPAVTGLKAVQVDDYIELTWNNLEVANNYYCRVIASATELPITDAASFYKYYYNNNDALDIYTYTTRPSGVKRSFSNVSATRPYMYFIMRPNSVPAGYYATNAWSNVAKVKYVEQKTANIPAVKNFRIEKLDNGNDWQLAWDPVDADVVIYAFAEGKKPANIPYYNYSLLDAYRVDTVTDANGNESTTYTYLSNKLTAAQKTAVDKYVRSYTVDGMNGVISSPEDAFDLLPGVKYNFIACTYDHVEGTQTPIATELDAKGFDRYTAMGAATKAVTYTEKISKPSVWTYATENSVKLNMSASNATGFVIYRKDGGKYKKLATITDTTYTDEGLKSGQKYSYKVEAYYYNPLTKKKSTSEATLKSVTTTAVRDFQVKATKASKNSVKLEWTKVKSVTKYEIYRTTSNVDTKTICKKLDYGNSLDTLSYYNYELIKTIKSASTTKYTDSKLTAGETYSYLVMAYYKDGSKTGMAYQVDSIAMELQTPQNVIGTLSGSAVTVKWDADKYASKYEIRYMVYDKYNNAKYDTWKKVSSKKNTYKIKIASGEYVSVQVRAYGSNKTYSDWTGIQAMSSLAVANNIKAVNDEKTGAIKITWKKVPGAKYYKVYRDTRMSTYNADEKKYTVNGWFISKEGNDNTSENAYYNNSVTYSEYYGVEGSIKGTTAYDYAQLEEGVKYYYYVVAFGEKGSQIASYVTSKSNTKAYASGKPASVVKTTLAVELANKKSKKVTITFNKVAGAKKYNIYRATKKNGEYKLLKTVTKTSYTDTKVKKGSTYYYKVEAVGTNGLNADMKAESQVKSIKVKK
ncbi:MAG: fibronectin type III domain-containing protein [Lachnospiraceae bacterium]|nr:fibronectin type III domain-containing protein [Lachnospiraceae bacterium]